MEVATKLNANHASARGKIPHVFKRIVTPAIVNLDRAIKLKVKQVFATMVIAHRLNAKIVNLMKVHVTRPPAKHANVTPVARTPELPVFRTIVRTVHAKTVTVPS